MVGKLVLTLVMLVIGVMVWRSRHRPQGSRGQTAAASSDLRLGAYLFIGLTLTLAAGLYYQRWHSDHQTFTVTLHRDGNTPSVSYTVYRYQLESRSFTTTDGVRITVADSERMEVTGPD